MSKAFQFSHAAAIALCLIASSAGTFAKEPERGWGSSWTQPQTANQKAIAELLKRSRAEARARRYEAALASANEAAKRSPQSVGILRWRAGIYTVMGRHQSALDDCNQALKMVSNVSRTASAPVYQRRAQVYYWMGQFRQARADLEKAVESNKEDASAYNALAWFLATCPDAASRDGKRAHSHAMIANDKSGRKDPGIIDTVAAAEAEMGDFAAAIQHQQMAFKLGRNYQWDQYARKRLELYQNHQAYREKRSPAEEMLGLDEPP
jgi:tetratricopeptide (TPR) repeat protein